MSARLTCVAYVCFLASVSAALFIVSASNPRPLLAWNVTASAPVGLYFIDDQPLKRGDLVVIRLPSKPSAFAKSRGYLRQKAFLLKPVAAAVGDRICRFHSRVLINGRLQAIAPARDNLGRWLPQWNGCQTLKSHEVFALSTAADSFDSRYFGALDAQQIIGTAMPIWTKTR